MTLEQKQIELEQGINQGVVESQEEVSASLDMSKFPTFNNWDQYLSDFDSQLLDYFDTYACNIFSGTGALEMYLNALKDTRFLADTGKTELSERFLCVNAGLNGSTGSSQAQWQNAVNTGGFVKWDVWPWTSNITEATFFEPLAPSIKIEGLNALKLFTPFHRSIGTDLQSITDALKYAPVKIFIGTGAAWNQGEPNVVPYTSNPMGHAVIVRYIDAQGIHIRDQYAPYLKCLAPNYKIYYAFQTLLKPKLMGQFKTQNYKGEARIVLQASTPDQWIQLCAIYGKDPNQFDETV